MDSQTILVYLPKKQKVNLRIPAGKKYTIRWFNVEEGIYTDATIELSGSVLSANSPFEKDVVLVLTGDQ